LAATSRMRQLKLFIGRPSDKLSSDLKALDREKCSIVTGLLTGHCTLRWHLHITTGLLESVMCRKCGQEEPSCHILCQCPALARHR
jgi:hypothetical protein